MQKQWKTFGQRRGTHLKTSISHKKNCKMQRGANGNALKMIAKVRDVYKKATKKLMGK